MNSSLSALRQEKKKKFKVDPYQHIRSSLEEQNILMTACRHGCRNPGPCKTPKYTTTDSPYFNPPFGRSCSQLSPSIIPYRTEVPVSPLRNLHGSICRYHLGYCMSVMSIRPDGDKACCMCMRLACCDASRFQITQGEKRTRHVHYRSQTTSCCSRRTICPSLRRRARSPG